MIDTGMNAVLIVLIDVLIELEMNTRMEWEV